MQRTRRKNPKMYASAVTVLSILVILCTAPSSSSSLAEKSPSISVVTTDNDVAPIHYRDQRLLEGEEGADEVVVAAGGEKEEKHKEKKKHKKKKHHTEEKLVEGDEEDTDNDADVVDENAATGGGGAYVTKAEEAKQQQIIEDEDAAADTNSVNDDNTDTDTDTNAAAPPASHCSLITTCGECASAALNFFTSSSNTQSCLWGKKEGSDSFSCFEIMVGKYTLEQQSFTCDTGEEYVPTALPPAETETNYDKVGGGGGEEKEEQEGSIMGAFLFVAFFLGVMYVRNQILERSGAFVGEGGAIIGGGGGDDLSTIMTNSTSGRTSSSGRNYNQETQPLASAADEEWGWEDGMDSTGDVELSTQSTSNKAQEDDDLQMALALSMSETPKSKTPSSSSSSTPKESKTTKSKTKTKKTQRTKTSSSSSVGGGKDRAVGITSEGKRTRELVSRRPSPRTSKQISTPSVDEWDEPIPSPDINPPSDPNDIEALLESTRPKHMSSTNYITSFSKKTPAPVPAKKKEEKKKEPAEDDIFAEMGLSSYPGAGSSSKPKASPPSSGSAWGAASPGFKATTTMSQPKPTAPAPRSTLLDATADLGDDGSANWDDDSDLDDLLDD